MKEAPGFLYLSDAVMETLGVTTDDAVASIEHLLHAQHREQMWSKPKSAVTLPDGRYLMTTLAAADKPGYFAVKQLVLNPNNQDPTLKQINGMITLLASETGLPLAYLQGNWITGIRTAALSAVAAKRLARVDSSVVAFIGCGVQAHSHLQAFCDLFPVTEVRAFGRGASNRDRLCAAVEKRGLKAVASASGQEAIDGADIVVTTVTLTGNVEPFLDARLMKPGAFASITDFALPWFRESLTCFDRIVVDDIEQERTSPTPVVSLDHVSGELVELVCNQIPSRQTAEERTAFMFRGLALGDLALAGVAYEKAKAAGRGVFIES